MKENHKTFIIEMIKHGDKTRAYQKAYPNCTDEHSARKSAERLLRHHPEIAAEIEEAAAYIQQRSYAEAYRLHTEQQKVKLLSMMDRREILARIAKCEIKVCRYVKDGNGYRMLFEDPHPREIIRAVEADTRIEDMCNRARNLADPKLSQFNIYIDGRPCDDPTAPINHELPPGIYMLPRSRKKLLPEQGIKPEHSDGEQTYRTGTQNELSPAGRGGEVRAGGGTLAQEKTPTAEQGIKPEHLSRQGGENTLSPTGGGGEVRARGGILAQEKTPAEQGIKPEHLSRQGGENTLSPAGGGGEVRAGGGTLALEKIPTTEQGIKTEHLSRQGGENTQHSALLGGDRGAFIPENSPLYPQYLALYQKRKLQAEDLLSASFYAQEQRSIASAPPPRILTPEEVRQLHEEADRKREEKKKQKQNQPQQPQYNTFGKMYFPPEGR